MQRAKKVVSDSPDIFVLNLPNKPVLFFEEIQITEGLWINRANQKGFWGQLK